MSAYRRIADEIAARIAAGTLRPGDRVPSTRDIVAQHGVAMATATKTLAWLREQGLVRAVPGVGTVVLPVAPAPRARRPAARQDVIDTAIRVADAEGLAGLSMRRVATEAGLPTMSLYRHVADKEELLLLMMERVFAANPPPPLTPARDGWRACVAAGARLQWAMYRRHRWLAEAVSFTRPLPARHAMAHTEYTMRALAGLDPDTRFRAAVMIANHVRGTAVSLGAEAQARHDTGLTDHQWMLTQHERFTAALAGAGLPLMADYLTRPGAEFDLDVLFGFGLDRLLDGLARLAPEDGDRGVDQREGDDADEVTAGDVLPLLAPRDEHHDEDQDADHALDGELGRVGLVVAAAAQGRREPEAGDDLDDRAPQHGLIDPQLAGDELRDPAAEQQREPDQVKVEQDQPESFHGRRA